MKKILVVAHRGQLRLTERLQKLGYEIVEQPHNLHEDRLNHRLLAGRVDVIIYRVCACCSKNQFDQLPNVSFCDNPEWTIPVVLVRGGDFAGQGYMILGALWEHTSTDEDFKLAIDSAITMAERFKAMGTK